MSLKLSTLGDKNLFAGQRSVAVNGLSPSANALSIAQIISQDPEPHALIVAPNAGEAANFYDNLKFFLKFFRRDINCSFYPGWESSPYSQLSPSIGNRVQRIRTLVKLLQNKHGIVITHPRALGQPTICPKSLQSRSIQMGEGDNYEILELENSLQTIGYQKVEPVLDPGTYAIRGGIVDIFSPSYPHPIRFNFFGEEIETARFFDTRSQRSLNNKCSEQLFIPPIREIETSREEIEVARSKIRAFADEHAFQRSSRDKIIRLLGEQIITNDMDYLIPFFNKNLSFLSDYLDNNTKIFWLDADKIASAEEKFIEKLSQDHKEAIKTEKIASPADKLFSPSEKLLSVEKFSQHFHMNPVALENTNIDRSINLSCSPNIDFKPKKQTKNNVDLDKICSSTKKLIDDGYKVFFVANSQAQVDRILFLLSQRDIKCDSPVDAGLLELNEKIPQVIQGKITTGFQLDSERIAFVTEDDIFGAKSHEKKNQINKEALEQITGANLDDLNLNDLVVHLEHGIGKYRGLLKLSPGGVEGDFVFIEYAGADKLYLPIYRLELLQKYVGLNNTTGKLDKLGSKSFSKTKEKAKAAIKDIAAKLLLIYAKRASAKGYGFSPPDEEFQEFEATFPFDETHDQQKAINETIADMCLEKPMDRLVCGDVGYGKTEIAVRAAFKCIQDKKQVAILVPTTILAEQHYQSFSKRFSPYDVKVGSLSRFRSPKEQKEIVASLELGETEIIVGTHRLLSKDVKFADLGLIIIDEEQRFGVEHKEKLKEFRETTDILTLTATPIPRTLHMSLMGMRDISIIGTPPADRLAIKTYVASFDKKLIHDAIKFELNRGGQIFFIHNRVQSIATIYRLLNEIIPEARVGVGHGQMPEKELEKVMLKFYRHDYDVLLCTSIVENGLDVSNANTILVNRADHFGLSQLYQIRGRVGRSQTRAYAYMLLPEDKQITDDAKERLQVLQRHIELGSGFAVASHDLELRGGGDLIGISQSGHVSLIGYDLYLELLSEEIDRLKGEDKGTKKKDIEINSAFPAFLPEQFVKDARSRLSIYKRLSGIDEEEKVSSVEAELIDRYGPMPPEAMSLLWLIKIKILLRRFGFVAANINQKRLSLTADERPKIDISKLMTLMGQSKNKYAINPDSKIIVNGNVTGLQVAHSLVRELVQSIASIS